MSDAPERSALASDPGQGDPSGTPAARVVPAGGTGRRGGPRGRAQGAGRRRGGWLLSLLGLTGSLAFAAILVLVWVLGTQSGLRFAVRLADDLAPGMLELARIEGRLLGRLTIEGLALRVGDLSARAGRLDLAWSPSALISGTLCVTHLAVSELDLVLPPGSDEPDAPLALPDLMLPWALSVTHASVESLRLFNPGEPSPFLHLERIELAGALRDGDLSLDTLAAALAEPSLSARASGTAQLRANYPMALALSIESRLDPAAALQGRAQVSGDLEALAIALEIKGSVDAELALALEGVLTDPSWEARLDLLGVALSDWIEAVPPDLQGLELSASLASQGTPADLGIRGRLRAAIPERSDLGVSELLLDLVWSDSLLEIKQLDINEQLSKARLQASGRLDLSGEGAAERNPIALTAVWEGLRWPLVGEAQVESNQGRAELSGDLQDFDYRLRMDVAGVDVPALVISLDGAGVAEQRELRSLRLDSLLLDTLGGRIQGAGTLSLAPHLSWNASLDAADLDPGLHVPDWPGRIAGRLSSRGEWTDEGANLEVLIERVDGTLRGYPVLVAGGLGLSGALLRVESLTASSGPSALSLSGQVDERLAIDFSLTSPDLTSLLPQTSGSLSARGTLSGPRAAPRLQAEFDARDAAWGPSGPSQDGAQGGEARTDGAAKTGVVRLSGTLDLGLLPEDPFEISLDAKDLRIADKTWSGLAVQGAGRLDDHRLTLNLTGGPAELRFEGTGSLTPEEVYEGRILRLDVSSSEFGEWGLQRPAPLAVGIAQGRISAGPVCVRGPSASGGCLEFAQASSERWSGKFDLGLGDLGLLAPVLPSALTLSGGARLAGDVRAEGMRLNGNLNAEVPQGVLRVPLASGPDQVLDFSGTRLTLDADAGALSARLAMPLVELGRIEANVTLPGWRLDDPVGLTQRLEGRLRADLRGLERISDLVPDVAGVTGVIDVDLGVRGTLAAPALTGEARLSDGGFELPLFGLRVEDLGLAVRASGRERLVLEGDAKVGGGRLAIVGEGSLAPGAVTAGVEVSGERLKIADSREYFALVSPRIAFNASAQGGRLSGEVSIPEARIRPRSLPAGTQTPSSDVLIGTSEDSAPWPLGIDLRLRLGRNVTIDAFGVRGRLAGDLMLRQEPGRVMLGDGQLQIIDGQYRLSSGLGLAADLAAPLDIVQGRLVFARSPVDNPGLLLQAERSGGSTSAGVRVLGTLRDPKLAFFSETDPGMTQAEVTKYLLTGIAPTRDAEGPTTGLAVGTYIAPKIYLEYETGLAGESNKVRLRYDLSNRIELQTETGESQGGDIFFTFER